VFHTFVRLCPVCLLLLWGCATSLPNVSKLAQETPTGTPTIAGPRGELSPRAARSVIERKGPGEEALIKSNANLMESLSGRPLTTGNRVSLLVDSPATYAAMLKAIEAAKDHINFETFTFSDDEIGRKFADAFIRKQQEGVQVNLIYDAIGSSRTPDGFFQHLKENGVNVLEFNPVDPAKARWSLRITQRDHRKVMVVDGKIGFTGGVNVSAVYSSSAPSLRAAMGSSPLGWIDTDIRIEGPAVAQMQRLFLDTWQQQKGPQLPERNYFPHLEARGDALAEVIGSTPGSKHRLTYVMYVAAAEHAYYSVHLTTPYFAPDRQMMKALTDAARRGVDVKLLLPSISDSNLVLYAGRSHYEDLLESGVRVYERRDRMIHAKTGTVDDVWSTVGSTNLDLWSFLRDNEINVIVVGKDFSDKVEQLFERDLAESNEITEEQWSHRPLSERLKEIFVRLLSHWL
jgi:cardiolipin synthase